VKQLTPEQIAAAFIASCYDEIEAPKPGNVHTFAGGHDMEASHFLDSAGVATPAIAAPGARVGARIRGAIDATFAEVQMNTNLGIILLCAPLACAAEAAAPKLRAALSDVLANLDAADAADVYAAIARASPGGLGRASRHDVHGPPPFSLLDAMREAIAETHAFGAGQPIALAVYLAFLSRFPDTHIVRKFGLETAEAVMREAQGFAARARSEGIANTLTSDLLAFDARLKEKRVNPGTSADLTVATLFAARLSGVLPISLGDG
jgi:triphosphoribosyl-dephospho-CoA synthase